MQDGVTGSTESSSQAAQASQLESVQGSYRDATAPTSGTGAGGVTETAGRQAAAAAEVQQLAPAPEEPTTGFNPVGWVRDAVDTVADWLTPEATVSQLADGRTLLEAGADDDKIEITQDQANGDVTVDVNGEQHTFTQDEANRLVVRAGDGEDTILTDDAVTANLTLEGNDGNDFIVGGAGHDRIEGGAGEDTLFGGAGRDYVYGGAGNDFIRGEEGNDILYGGDGADDIFAGAGDDYVDGGRGNDVIYGGTGHDILSGGLGDDRLEGGDGGNVGSQSGNDIFYAGQGNDRVSGGTGDVAYVEAGDEVVRGYREENDMARTDVEIDPNLGATSIELDSSMSADERERILSDIETLRSSPTGQQGLAAIDDAAQRTGHTVTIHTYSDENGAARSPNWNDAMLDPATGRPGPGTNADIDYNPQLSSLNFTNGRSDPLDNSGDFHDLPPVAVLYHEMAHANDIQTGNIDFRNYTGQDPFDNGSRSGRPIANAERVAVGLPYDHDGDPRTAEQTDVNHPQDLTENALRNELALPDRPSYAR